MTRLVSYPNTLSDFRGRLRLQSTIPSLLRYEYHLFYISPCPFFFTLISHQKPPTVSHPIFSFNISFLKRVFSAMNMRISFLPAVALFAYGSLVFAGPLSRRQETNNLLASINSDPTNFQQDTPISLALLPTPQDGYSFLPSPAASGPNPVLPDYPTNNFAIGNTLPANTLPDFGSPTGDGITQEGDSTNLGNLAPNSQPVASIFDGMKNLKNFFTCARAGYPQENIEYHIKKMTGSNVRWCIYDLTVNIVTCESYLQFQQCGSGDWQEFSNALRGSPRPGFGAFRLNNNKILSIMIRLHRYDLENSEGNTVTINELGYLATYKERWVDSLRTSFPSPVSIDTVVSNERLDDLGNAVMQGANIQPDEVPGPQ